MRLTRKHLILGFCSLLAWAQFREGGDPAIAARLLVETEPHMPVRVYLWKDGRPFRLSPVGAMLPLRVDLLYRERMWTAAENPETLEVTGLDISHFILLKGRGEYKMPQGKYRLEAYRGFFYEPASVEFELKAGETTRIVLPMKNWLGAEAREWISGDDHIHLVRDKREDPIYLGWLQAEDLNVAMFLQLQRQMDAGVQYGFGPQAEAKLPGYSIRSGHESRSDLFGHINLLGGRELVQPLSVGPVYSNNPNGFPYPAELFRKARAVGAIPGYAHFDGGARFGDGAPPRMRDAQNHSTLLMDLALRNIEFIEVFQGGYLNDERWYELLNAGFEIRGIAGSDFPANLGRRRRPVSSCPYSARSERWHAPVPAHRPMSLGPMGIPAGEVVVSNGPMVRLEVKDNTARCSGQFMRPLQSLELIVDGRVVERKSGDGSAKRLESSFPIPPNASWVAARVSAVSREGEPPLRAHTNPRFLKHGVVDPERRQELADHFAREIEYYRQQPSLNIDTGQRELFFREAETALVKLKQQEK